MYSQQIEDHAILAPGVSLTEYEDGTRVIVNTGATAWIYHGQKTAIPEDKDPDSPGVLIKADDYIVIRQGD